MNMPMAKVEALANIDHGEYKQIRASEEKIITHKCFNRSLNVEKAFSSSTSCRWKNEKLTCYKELKKNK